MPRVRPRKTLPWTAPSERKWCRTKSLPMLSCLLKKRQRELPLSLHRPVRNLPEKRRRGACRRHSVTIRLRQR